MHIKKFTLLADNTDTGVKKQQDVNARIQQIEEQSKMLNDANIAIANIASQTNLLAMNAASEAFSVVSEEINSQISMFKV